MVRTADGRPPRVDVPADVLSSDRLAPYMAGLALEHGPIFRLLPRSGPWGGRRVVYMVGPEANQFVLVSHRRNFSQHYGWAPVLGKLGHGLINMDPPDNQMFRSLLSPAFGAAFMERYLGVMRTVIADRTRGWSQCGEVDLIAGTRSITFDIAAAALLGLQPGVLSDVLRERFYAFVHSPAGDPGGRDDLDTLLLEIVASRQERPAEEPPESALDFLLRARDDQGAALSTEQLLGQLNILLVAGYETTMNLGAWVLYLLSAHPDEGVRVDAELAAVLGGPDVPISIEALHRLPHLTNAIREAGRLEPPVMFLPRVAVSEFEFDGCTVSAGTPVFLALAAGHRLPTVFTRPEAFDPDRLCAPREEAKRHPHAMATFGGGARTCLGAGFAAMEVAALVAHVRRNYELTPMVDRVVKMETVVQWLPEGIPMRVSALPGADRAEAVRLAASRVGPTEEPATWTVREPARNAPTSSEGSH